MRKQSHPGTDIEYNGYATPSLEWEYSAILFMGLDVGVRMLLLRQSGSGSACARTVLAQHATAAGQPAPLFSGFILFVLFKLARLVFQRPHPGQLLVSSGDLAAFSLMDCRFRIMIAALGKTVRPLVATAIMATLINVNARWRLGADQVFPAVMRKSRCEFPPLGNGWLVA